MNRRAHKIVKSCIIMMWTILILSDLHWTTFNKETHVFLPCSQGKQEIEAYLPLSHPHEPWKNFRTATFRQYKSTICMALCRQFFWWGRCNPDKRYSPEYSIYTPPKFNIAPEKMMIGRLYFPFRMVYFQGPTVKLSGGKAQKNWVSKFGISFSTGRSIHFRWTCVMPSYG